MKRGTLIVAAIGLFLGLAAAGCGGGSSSSEGASAAAEGGKAKIAGQTVNNHGTKTVSGDETEMELDDYYFGPTLLRGKPGAQVKLELKNEGSDEHNLTIASQGIDKDVEAGEDANVTVTIPKSGVVAFYCKYHRSMGMAGALTTDNASGMREITPGSGTETTPTSTKPYGY
jgi:plastocyanin